MYGMFAYIYNKIQPNVGKYTIHESYGPMGYKSTNSCGFLKAKLFQKGDSG